MDNLDNEKMEDLESSDSEEDDTYNETSYNDSSYNESLYNVNNMTLNRKEIVKELKMSKKSINESVKAVGAISPKELPQPKEESYILQVIIERPIIFLDEVLAKINMQELNNDRKNIEKLILNLSNESNFILEE